MRRITILLTFSLLTCGTNGLDPNNPIDLGTPINPNNPVDPIASLDSELKNGTRLHNKYITAADGTVALAGGLHDTQLNTDCTFSMAEDDMQRCLPPTAFIDPTGFFLDSACTQQLAFSSAGGPALQYARDYSGTCSMINKLISVTKVTPIPANVYTKAGGTCTSAQNPYPSQRSYRVGSPVPPTQFVAGTVTN